MNLPDVFDFLLKKDGFYHEFRSFSSVGDGVLKYFFLLENELLARQRGEHIKMPIPALVR